MSHVSKYDNQIVLTIARNLLIFELFVKNIRICFKSASEAGRSNCLWKPSVTKITAQQPMFVLDTLGLFFNTDKRYCGLQKTLWWMSLATALLFILYRQQQKVSATWSHPGKKMAQNWRFRFWHVWLLPFHSVSCQTVPIGKIRIETDTSFRPFGFKWGSSSMQLIHC